MKFELSNYFSPFELFSALIPGGVGAFIIWTLLQNSGLGNNLPALTETTGLLLFGVASLILGYAVQPPAHLLNIAYDRTYRAYRRRKGDPYLEFAKQRAVKDNPIILETGSVYEWAKTRLQAVDPQAEKHIGNIQGISKMFRGLCFFAIIGAAAAVILGQWQMALLLLVLAGLFFLVFCERRWTASSYVYQRLKELETDKVKTKRKKQKAS
jgi:hypothetical protein